MTATQQIEVKDSAARSAQAVDDLRDVQGEKMILNMGPSHPATHGVLRLVLELDGEIIERIRHDDAREELDALVWDRLEAEHQLD